MTELKQNELTTAIFSVDDAEMMFMRIQAATIAAQLAKEKSVHINQIRRVTLEDGTEMIRGKGKGLWFIATRA